MLYCPKGHILTPMVLTELSNRGTGYRGGFVCDACREGSCVELYHCDHCNYDLCRPCGTRASARSHCPKGHILLRFTADDLSAFDKRKPTRTCDMCGESDSVRFMMVCPGCDFHVCPKCYRNNIVCFFSLFFSFCSDDDVSICVVFCL